MFSFISSTTPRLSTTTTTLHTAIHFYPTSIVHPMNLCNRVLHPHHNIHCTITITTTATFNIYTCIVAHLHITLPSAQFATPVGRNYLCKYGDWRQAAMLSGRPNCQPTTRGMHDSAKTALQHSLTHSLSPLPHARLATANPTHTHTCTDRWNDRHTRIRRCPAPAGQILKLSLPPNAISNSKRLDKECLLRLELGEGVNQNSISSLAFSFSLTSAAAAPPRPPFVRDSSHGNRIT